MTVLSSNNLS